VLIAAGATLVTTLSLLSPSTSRILVWPWAGFATAFWLLPIAVALWRLASRREHSRLGGALDLGFGLLAGAAVLSALASPLRGISLTATLPVLGAGALPYALRPLFAGSSNRTTRVFLLIGALAFAIVAASGLDWLIGVVQRGGIAARNAFPFGHSNAVGSFSVLAASWLFVCATRTRTWIRALSAVSASLAVLVALSSASRGAVLALGAGFAVAAGLHFWRRGQRLRFLALVVAALLLGVATNGRLRDLALHGRWAPVAQESNDQRFAMLLGGAQLGAERPALGWGPGTVPHVFPRVRGDLPGSVDNFLHLHNAFAQTWATLGLAGLLAVVLIAFGVLHGLRAEIPWPPERIALAAGLVATATVLLFDHPLDIPAFAVLAAAHLAAWVGSNPPPAPGRPRVVAIVGAVSLVPVLVISARDLAARAAYAHALEAAAENDPERYVAQLRRADRLMSGDPFYLQQLGAHFATGHPFPDQSGASVDAASDALQRALFVNSDLEYAHYNLGWLLLERDPAGSARHFLAAARLAPRRGGVYFGLGLAQLRTGDRAGAVRAFATEWLNDPAFAFSELWFSTPFGALRPEIVRVAAAALPADDARSAALATMWREQTVAVPSGPAFRRVRSGYGVLAGHPDGPPPIDVNVQATPLLTPELRRRCPPKGWLRGGFLLEFLSASSR